MNRLNLGCSTQLLEGYINVDIVQPADQIADLTCPWPWDDSSIDEIRAHDIFEHLLNKRMTMNEAHRVLKPGGRLDLFVPTTAGFGAFQDPQHISFWTPNDIFYFSESFAEWQRFHEAYGITANFMIVEQSHRLYGQAIDNVWKWHAILEAVK